MWTITRTHVARGVSARAVWERAYADARAWPRWNPALATAEPEGPFAVGTRVRVRWRTGVRVRFTLVEVEPERVFTDEGRVPGARVGHRHELEPTADGVLLTNTIYVDGPAARLWALVVGFQARRGLPVWQPAIARLAAEG